MKGREQQGNIERNVQNAIIFVNSQPPPRVSFTSASLVGNS